MKNKLLLYEGGGYSGCIYEWNACFWDNDGKWIDIYHSGSGGIEEERVAQGLINHMDDSGHLVVAGWEYSNTDVVDLEDKDSIEVFQKKYNEGFVVSVVEAINNHYNDEIAFYRCDECGIRVFGYSNDEGQAVFPEGCSGIATQYSGMVCSECWTAGYCNRCNTYVGQGDMFNRDDYGDRELDKALLDEDNMNGPFCTDCVQADLNDIAKEIAFISRLTGVPDMFPDASDPANFGLTFVKGERDGYRDI